MSARHGWPRCGRDGSWRPVVALLLAVTGACAPGGKTNAKEKGAVMTSEGVSLRRLGTLSPHLTYRGTTDRDFVDPASIVLWRGSAPAVALGFEVESRWRKAVQKIAPLENGVKVPGFPVTCTLEAHDDATSEDSVDAIDPRGAGTLDLDGDGAEELLVPRRHGGVEVHSLRGPLARYPSPGGGYRRFSELDVKIGARDVAYVLSRSDQEGVSDRNLLLRVDGKGVTRVTLQGLEKREIRALGALQRKGSPDVDELLVLAAGERGGTVLARYRPDGKAIGPAREMYVKPSPVSAFRFVPESSSAVLEVEGGVLVITPEKPVNWIREIKVQPGVDPRHVDIHHVADLDGDPKVVHGVGEELWAVNQKGECFAPAGGGRWSPLRKAGPYLRVPVPPGETLWFVWDDGGGRLFAVSSGERGTRPMSHEDWARAADRYLPPGEAEAFRRMREPSLDGEHGYRDVRMKRERERRHVERVGSVEEWKRLLPDSYAEVLKFDADHHDVKVESRFLELRGDARAAERAPDPAGLRAFLADLEVPARTTFLVIDGTAVSSASVPGSPLRTAETQVGAPVEYRIAGGRLTAILALEKGDAEGSAPPAFYEVDAPLAPVR